MAVRFIVIFLSLLVTTNATYAQSLEEGEKYYKKVCRACHGPKAKGTNSFPKLAGDSAELISSRLERYRGGETIGPNSALMLPVAKKLSDEDIVNLAFYISETFPE